MDGLASSAFSQVIDGRNDDGASTSGIEDETDVAEVGSLDSAEVGHCASGVKTDEGLIGVGFFVDGKKLDGLFDVLGPDIDGFEDPTLERKQVSREGELAFAQARVLQDLRNVAMMQDAVGIEVLGHFAEAGGETGLSSCATDTGLGIADDAAAAIDGLRFDQGANGQVGGGWIAAGVGD